MLGDFFGHPSGQSRTQSRTSSAILGRIASHGVATADLRHYRPGLRPAPRSRYTQFKKKNSRLSQICIYVIVVVHGAACYAHHGGLLCAYSLPIYGHEHGKMVWPTVYGLQVSHGHGGAKAAPACG